MHVAILNDIDHDHDEVKIKEQSQRTTVLDEDLIGIYNKDNYICVINGICLYIFYQIKHKQQKVLSR